MAQTKEKQDSTICGTPLTIEIVRDAVNAKLGTKGTIKSWTDEEIGAGKGFVSVMCKIKIDWNETDAKLPATIIAKVPTTNKLSMLGAIAEQMLDVMKKEIYKCHNAEISVFETFAKCDKPPAPLPFAYAFKELSGPDALDQNELSYIIMEDLSEKSAILDMIMQNKLTLDQQHQLVKVLAEVHAWSLNNPELVKQIKVMDVKEIAGKMAGGMDQGADQFIQTLDEPEWMNFYGETIVSALKSRELQVRGSDYMEIIDQHKEFGLPDMMCHGDVHGNNLLLKKDKDGKPTGDLYALIDWQGVQWGNAMVDVARTQLMVDQKDRTIEAQKRTAKVYYDAFEKAMKAAGKEMPFTESQLWEAYSRAFIIFSAAFAPFFASMGNQIKSGVLPCEDPEKGAEGMKLESKLFFEDALSMMQHLKL